MDNIQEVHREDGILKDVEKLLKKLISISSVSGDERELGLFLASMLEGDFNVKTQKLGDRCNVLATIGKPNVLLTTHMDTVPGKLALKEDKQYIYGRGACDAKGSMAAMICAGLDAASAGVENFGLLFDVGEETDLAGIKKALYIVKPKHVIVGEPTGLKAGIGQKGVLDVKISSIGKAAHSSTPYEGVSAINRLLDILQKLRKMNFPHGDLGLTTVNIGRMSGGVVSNIIPDYAEAEIEFRTVKPNKGIIRTLERITNKYNFEIICDLDPVPAFDSGIAEVLGAEKIIVPYFTEMFFWSQSKAVVFGPGNPKFAHTTEERIDKSELERGRQTYLMALRNSDLILD